MINRYSIDEIRGKLTQLNQLTPLSEGLSITVLNALECAPKNVVDHVIDNCRFIHLPPRTGGLYIPKTFLHNGDMESKDLLLFPSSIDTGYMNYHIKVILHECAHSFCGHQTTHYENEHNKHEKEAEQKVDEWLKGIPEEQKGVIKTLDNTILVNNTTEYRVDDSKMDELRNWLNKNGMEVM